MPSPYIPNTEEERRAMLATIGVASAGELFADIPEKFRHPRLSLPPPLSEKELLDELGELARRNANLSEHPCFLGAGSYRHFIPSIVHHVTGRSEFYTSYTPYQAEISQGNLQAIYEFQSLVCLLTGMEVASAGMYDGATALAEAALMACRITRRYKVATLETVSPIYMEVLKTYLSAQDIAIETLKPGQPLPGADVSCVIVQSPNFFGHLEDLAFWSREAHEKGALLVVSADPISLGMFRPPGDFGVDIAVGEGQPLGNPPNFGGPYVGLLASRFQYARQMPGRIVGKTTDTQGREGYVLTLQPREQHIRRERATSNICTNEALVALAATVYLAALGRNGLRRIAELCYHKAHYAAKLIGDLPGYAIPLRGIFFKEFVVQCPVPPSRVNKMLMEKGIVGGLDVSSLVPNGMLICVTEMNTRGEIEALVTELKGIGSRSR